MRKNTLILSALAFTAGTALFAAGALLRVGAPAHAAGGPPRLFPLLPNVSETLLLPSKRDFSGGPGGGWCGTPKPTKKQIRVEQGALARVRALARGINPNERDSGTVRIPVWFHVITTSTGAGDISDTVLYAQLKVLNKAYSGRDSQSTQTGQQPSAQATANTPFRFELAGITRTANNSWYIAGTNPTTGAETTASRQMKTTLRRGGPGTLNLYLNNVRNGDGLLGYATYPSGYASDPGVDGVVCLNGSVPSGAETPYNFGDTATHEVGHWLGLFHTFEGGCSASAAGGGDFVADTPAEASEFYGMPQSNPNRDTCPTLPGRDPTENYMDYTDDDGLFQFTPGQSQRMDDLHLAFRS